MWIPSRTRTKTYRPVHSKLEIRTTCHYRKVRSYKLLKQKFKREGYLKLPSYLRVPIARLGTSSHPLRIEKGWYKLPSPIPVKERFCWFCEDGSVEDDLHFLFECHLYHSKEEKRELINCCSTLTNEDK